MTTTITRTDPAAPTAAVDLGPSQGISPTIRSARPRSREASRADRERYLTSGLQPVDCRFCHVTVTVKRLGPGHTAVQWNTEASQRCAYFAEVRESGGDTARTRSCPRLSDSIEHAVAEGYLDDLHDPRDPSDLSDFDAV